MLLLYYINIERISETDASKFLEIYRRLMGGKDEELREDNNELGEKRAEAFEAYEEKCEPTFHLGKRACPAISTCGPSFNNYDPKVSTTTAKGWFKPKY
jgi:hypothetical protein